MTRLGAVTLLASISGALGCGTTFFYVHVRERPPGGPIEGANVWLYHDSRDPCAALPTGGSETDDAGTALVQARGCGSGMLWVSADGYRSVWQEVDSCDDTPRRVVLEHLPPEPNVGTPEVVAARAFLTALHEQDREALTRLLADPNDLTLYLDRASPSRRDGCAIRFLRVQAGGEPQVVFDSVCDTGCSEVWRIVLTPREAGFRVRTLEPVSQ